MIQNIINHDPAILTFLGEITIVVLLNVIVLLVGGVLDIYAKQLKKNS